MELIYKITNLKNGKFYIGKTSNIERRWKEHLSLAGKKRHPLYDAILHYGAENFVMEVVDKADKSLIDTLEREWIEKTKAIEIGYNLTEGGTGGDTFSNMPDELKELTRKKLSIKAKISNLKNKDIHRKNGIELWKSEEYVAKVKTAHEKAMASDDMKKKLSEAMLNTLQNPELRKKWSDVKKGSLNGRCLGNVIVTNLEGNETKYETAKEAAQKLKVTAHNIREHCRNNTTFQRGIYKGWKFRFDEIK